MTESKAVADVDPRAEAAAELTPAPPVSVFQGYDSVTGGGMATALTGETRTTGGESSLHYRVCEDVDELAEALEINQSLSISFGPFGSIDEKMKLVQKLNVTTHSTSIVVYAKHTVGSETMTDVALKPGRTPPVGNAALKAHFRGYGDAFVSSITRGGEYYAVYTFYAQTRDEQTELEVEMKAQGLFEGVTLDAALQVKLNKFTSSSKMRVSVEQRISGILNPALPSADKIIDFAAKFSSLPLDSPTVIRFDTSGYERVPDFGDFQPIADNRDFFVGDEVVAGLTASLVKLEALQNQIAWLQRVYAYYGGHTDAKVNDVAAKAKSDLAALNKLLHGYHNDPTAAFTAPGLASLAFGSPSLAYAINESPAQGGGGGAPFNDVDVLAFASRQTRVSALQLRTSSYVEKLHVVYQGAAGTFEADHGGDAGTLTSVLTLLPGQFVTKIAGHSGTRVDNLQITVSDGRSVGGGGGAGGPFEWTVPKGSFVLGFAGRSGGNLDQIRVVYAGFQPATWG
jgi:hypothetical protein